MQQEIEDAAAAAQRHFYDKYPNKEDWTTKSVHEFINKATSKVKFSSISELNKQLPIADPKHTPELLGQLKLHYKEYEESPEMQQENLWMFATSTMDSVSKVKWLQRWNQSLSLREFLKFPKLRFNDHAFPPWLYKATWWAHVYYAKHLSN